ncbi:7358_t:CDS:1, partial [Dentiscutata erythropus]
DRIKGEKKVVTKYRKSVEIDRADEIEAEKEEIDELIIEELNQTKSKEPHQQKEIADKNGFRKFAETNITIRAESNKSGSEAKDILKESTKLNDKPDHRNIASNVVISYPNESENANHDYDDEIWYPCNNEIPKDWLGVKMPKRRF